MSKFALIGVNRFSFGSRVWAKIPRADKYLNTLREKITNDNDYGSALESLSSKGKSSTRRVSGNWTFGDLLVTRAKRKLKTLQSKFSEE